MMLAESSYAEWKYLTESNYGGLESSYWVDKDSIKKNGNKRKFWGVTNYIPSNSFGALSNRYLNEFDCKEEQNRFLAFSAHSEHFAKGTILQIDEINPKDSPWKPVAPNTVNSEIMKIVCSK